MSLSQDKYVFIPSAHELIVSQQDYDRVQIMTEVRAYKPNPGPRGHYATGFSLLFRLRSPRTCVKESEPM